ncbi:MAG: 3-dehydroquinate synthase [Acidobacteriota bacterium]|nr:3-dehydroquinate synthase [Acidobacteriota bacterium]
MLETVEIAAASGRSQILIGTPLEALTDRLAGSPAVVVTDRTVRRLHGRRFPANVPVLLAEQGERRKSLRTVARLYVRLLAAGVDRSTWIVGVGGGVVCDLAGFVASTILRGVPFAFAPTTLLAQADAAIGGKNGVNIRNYKNMAGTVHQPRFVLCDLSILATLPPAELRNGFAEIVKAAAVADSGLFKFLERNVGALLRLEPVSAARAVAGSVRVKAAVVGRDEEDRGERKILNFGHTIGHALEKTQRIPHGLAVAAGMSLAAEISVRRGMLAEEEARRLERLLAAFGLPARPGRRMKAAKVLDAVFHDKKKTGDAIDFVLLRSIGRAVVEPIRTSELEEILRDLR